MINVSYNFTGRAKFDMQLEGAKKVSITASKKALDRCAQYVLYRATVYVPRNEDHLARSLHRKEATKDSVTGIMSASVETDEPYGGYVEKGFKGHFVPFHIAPDLYRQAIRSWGWVVPTPGSLKNPKLGRLYLIPLGRTRPVWGAFVSGKAQPYLGPAFDDLVNSKRYILYFTEEYQKLYKAYSRTIR